VITPAFARTMAAYNQWQNEALLATAATLDPAKRDADAGLFFGSITGTLNHLLWADRLWLHRFAGTAKPAAASIAQSTTLFADWPSLTAARRLTDRAIIDWADNLRPDWLAGDLGWYSGSLGRDVNRPCAILVAHFFNHQTHHRGQVHAALTRAGVATAPTDLPFMPSLG
jgi:uncharacterized damage-inducible protein DinB